MLGVLMTGARAGQHRPGLADTANLIWGALLIRVRPARRGTAWPLWREALAVVSVLLPLMVLAYFTLLDVSLLVSVRPGSPIFDAFARLDAEFLGGWLLVAVLALLRLRRTAALAAAALLIWLAYSSSQAVNWSYIDAPSMLALVAAGLETAALLASPGPARARADHELEALRARPGDPTWPGGHLELGGAGSPLRHKLDHDHSLRRHPERDGAGLPAGQTRGGPSGAPGLLPDRGVARAAVDDRRPRTTPHRGGRGRCGSR